MTITLRTQKGSELTFQELDNNFTDLDGRVTTLESAPDSDSQTLTLAGDDLTITGGNTVSLSTLSTEVVDDTSPQLGGNLDLNGKEITSSGGSAITEILDVLLLSGGNNGIIMRTKTSAGKIVIGDQAGDIVLGNSSNSVEFVNDVDVDFTNTKIDFTNATITGLSIVQGIDDLSDVDTSTTPPGVGQVLKWDGAQWEPANDSSGSGGATWATLGDKNNASGPLTVALGMTAGLTNQGLTATAIGGAAGSTDQDTGATAVGYQAGFNNQGVDAVAVGKSAGRTNQGESSVAIGDSAGHTTQGDYAVAIGNEAGNSTQGTQAIALGSFAGLNNQGAQTVAVGMQSGEFYQGGGAVAVGLSGGGYIQGQQAVAIGLGAGENVQGESSIAIGLAAGSGSKYQKTYVSHAGTNLELSDTTSLRVGAKISNTFGVTAGTEITAIVDSTNVTLNQGLTGTPAVSGLNFHQNGQEIRTTAIGYQAGQFRQKIESVAIGKGSGYLDQAERAVALGVNTGRLYQGVEAIAIGPSAGNSNQETHTVAIGANAGSKSQSINAVAIGYDAGTGETFGKNYVSGGFTDTSLVVGNVTDIEVGMKVTSADGTGFLPSDGVTVVSIDVPTNTVTISAQATEQPSGTIHFAIGQGDSAVAIGYEAGKTKQGNQTVAIGKTAGTSNQGLSAVAIGQGAAGVNQGASAVAIGETAGLSSQGANAIAIGANAGLTNQGGQSVAIGKQAGYNNQSADAVAVGEAAGNISQGDSATALGKTAGYDNQGNNAVAVGYGAGSFTQGNDAVAVGNTAGYDNQGTDAIAIGNQAGYTNQAANSIVINATGNILNNTQADAFVVRPVRNASGTHSMEYNPTTGEITYDTLASGGLPSRSPPIGATISLADAAQADLDITGFKSYALLTITTDKAARVRLYVNAATRTADASRAEGVDPTSDAGLIAEVITTGAETVIISPGAIGFNLESSPTTNIPCRVTNKSGSTGTVQVGLNILQLEA